MRIIRHSPTGGRITEFVKEDRARVNIKVNPSLQYMDGIELAASIDDTTTAIVYLRWDDLREIVIPAAAKRTAEIHNPPLLMDSALSRE